MAQCVQKPGQEQSFWCITSHAVSVKPPDQILRFTPVHGIMKQMNLVPINQLSCTRPTVVCTREKIC